MTSTTEISHTSITNPVDGIDVTAAARRLFTVPTFLTRSAWDIAVKWSQPVIYDQYGFLGIEPGEDYEDVRLWDVLFMAWSGADIKAACRRSSNHEHASAPFVVTVVPDVPCPKKACEVTLHLHFADEGLIIHSADELG